ncbi:methyl-accepting chemotaxis protein [Pseudomonas sp. AN-1]|uniref:methyl-accepting chemotaxis protein n=1 Tax=Pseudomonas sp. AN-1 TaxID=3096605 RepID=UPI002A6B1090|nr:methyl-accepting chemotaxis protein [Pseudomonas sp. AN-1]WPP46834.1 methyl-accepting chemotaxis protein [Pseudomonas sp. AN-1]
MNIRTSSSREYTLSPDDFLISRTDLTGKITYANPAFIEVSGFAWDELHGAPHNIVRHPDMPREAFDNLWSTVKAGRAWNGLVKNRRKNGEFYWVQAHVTPYFEAGQLVGYASVRTRAEPQAIALANRVYEALASGRAHGYRLVDGELRRSGLAGLLGRINPASLGFGSAATSALVAVLLPACYWLGRSSGMTDVPVPGLDLALLAGGTALPCLLGRRTVRASLAPLEAAKRFNSQIAAGNLSACLPDLGRGELAQLGPLMDIMRKSLSSIALDVNRSMHSVAEDAANIAQSNHALAARTEEQAASLQETAASMEQITATVEQNAGNARHANQLAEQASGSVRESGEVMHRMVSKMESIAATSRQMSEIIALIDAIAFQTNILALNASVEAARAGEQGRGFAVVASEVRLLAGRTAAAAKEIHELIANSSQEIDDGVGLVRASEQAIDEVIESVTRVSDIMAEISSASAEQSAGIAQIGQAIVQLDGVTQKNAGMVQHARHVSHDLNEQVRGLAQAISILQIGQRERLQPDAAPPARAPAAVGNPPRPQRQRAVEAEEAWEAF